MTDERESAEQKVDIQFGDGWGFSLDLDGSGVIWTDVGGVRTEEKIPKRKGRRIVRGLLGPWVWRAVRRARNSKTQSPQ